MRVLGLDITRQKALLPSLSPVPSHGWGSWWPLIKEPFSGAWQKNREITVQDVLTYSAVWACVTIIASDISKLWVKLVEKDDDGIWTETESSAFSPVLRKPNRYQTRVKFFEHWMLSKLIRGNTYALKQRDQRRVVTALYLLDPQRVSVLVSPDGSVFYALSQDALSGLDEPSVTVPASEIIHDVMVPLYHPLVGVSPIHACGLAAMQGLKIQGNSEQFFANQSQPGGILTAPGMISEDTAKRLKENWETSFSGANRGRVAVVGDGLTFEAMSVNAHDAQLIEQLKWTEKTVCSCFHVPPWKIGIEPMPPYGNIQAGNIEYYSQALQGLIENLELCLDEGLELPRAPRELGVEFDLDALLRMDTATQMDIVAKGVGSAIFSPNEGRAQFERKPVAGGNTPYLQEQNWPLAHLAARELPTRPITSPAPVPPAVADDMADDELDKAAGWLLKKELEMAA